MTTTSVIANLAFASVTAFTAYKNSMLDAEKKRLENALLLEKSTPDIQTFYALTEVPTLRGMLRSKEPLPFAPGVQRYRFTENPVFARLSVGLGSASQSGAVDGTVFFLVVANTSDLPARSVVLHATTGSPLTLGEIEPHTALLVGTEYHGSGPRDTSVTAQEYSVLQFEVRAASDTVIRRPIPKPASPSWVVQVGNVRSWARALPNSGKSPLLDVPR